MTFYVLTFFLGFLFGAWSHAYRMSAEDAYGVEECPGGWEVVRND